eukprot:snap_masked-scaffold_84-processed-gene-0.9-mRNA-1 protein AED:0.40 eAED:0.40 QI:0/-1/0/1/-1/1/1/0/130
MRLITHNMLVCNKKGVKNGYPLKIEIEELVEEPTDYTPEFVKAMLAKVDYAVFYGAVKQVKEELLTTLPSPELMRENNATETLTEEQLSNIHKCLMELSVKEGALVCPESGRKFPISNGIPNMLLNEDEV